MVASRVGGRSLSTSPWDLKENLLWVRDQLFPLLHRLPERFFLIKHVKLADESEIVSINGQINPAAAIRSGEMQFWRIAHIGASEFYKFRVEGMPLYVVATDGHALSRRSPLRQTLQFASQCVRIKSC